MYVRMSANGAPIGDASVEAEQVMISYEDDINMKILDGLIDEAANKLRRMYGLDER